ncbi:hypothetical protein AYL99_00999 [Fonsecaea erecta]|uniref:DUF2470 domain-containing protein n=1 Tax=Fonsecaea erecta TaxID=1367422 RepID=A0A178ZZ66_9EURO|nr:hypothetical protein AYL99_00999 [Fonsecaea erecta]OAP65027.1 hypothetical protein AYL99_00999 [Fonsecaea erecta]
MSASTAPRGPPDASAMKTRIITHMNEDHQLSLRLYLQHYSHVPSPGTVSAQMLDITTEHMIISSGYGRHVILFEPPMKSLMEARERLVTMHEHCLNQLDLSDIVVDTYVLPDRAWQWALSGLCLLIFATFPFRESLRLESGSWISRVWSLGGAAPWLAKLCYMLAPAVLGVIVVFHCGEAMWFIQRRLRRHWVEWGSVAWTCWVVDCLVEGGGCLSRFDRVVKKMEMEKKGGGKH